MQFVAEMFQQPVAGRRTGVAGYFTHSLPAAGVDSRYAWFTGLSLWLIGSTVSAEPGTLISRACVQSPDPAEFQDYWRSYFAINFSDRQEGLTVSSIICGR